MLPGLNAAAVGLITAAVFQLSFSVRANSPTPVASTCIGAPSRCHVYRGRIRVHCSSLMCCCAPAQRSLGMCAWLRLAWGAYQSKCAIRDRQHPIKGELCHAVPHCAAHSAAGIIGFCMVDFLAVPAPAAIGAGGLLGAVAWAAKMN